jgi:hypothetical protein
MTRWELNRERKRRALVEAGLAQMLVQPIAMLRSVLNASSLGAAADIPKDTAYRLFREGGRSSADPIVTAVAQAAAEPGWAGFDDSLAGMAGVFDELMRREVAFDEAIVEAMVANIASQFRSPGGPVGWIFQAAAMTASPAWQGEQLLDDDDRAVAGELLAARGAFYRRMTDDLAPMLAASLSLLGRRPGRGLDVRRLVSLLHAFIDGAVLRLYVEPDAFSTRLVGEAMLALVLAFSEDGSCNDPRCPSDETHRKVYDRILAVAGRSWATADERDVPATARQAAVDAADAAALFPSTADLADSVLWTRVLGGGSLVAADPEPGEVADHRPDRSGPERSATDGADAERSLRGSSGELAMLFALLRRLREAVAALPGAADVVRRQLPVVGPGVCHELRRQAAEGLNRHCPGVDAAATAAELVDAAFAGAAGWPAAATLMRVLQRSAT